MKIIRNFIPGTDENGFQTIGCGQQEKAALQRNTLKMKLNVRMNL